MRPMLNSSKHPEQGGLYFHLCEPSEWSLPSESDVVFQMANLVLVIALVAPNNKPLAILFMHALLVLAYLMITAWSWTLLLSPDVFSWNFSLMMLNLIQMVYNIYRLRPIQLSSELENVYKKLFKPIKVPRSVFVKLVSSEHATIDMLYEGDSYATQNLTRTNRLSLLLSGRVTAVSDSQFVHHIEPGQFLDAPEFESNTSGDDKFQVSLIATEASRILTWQRSAYKYMMAKDNYLQLVMSTLIGRDITNKLYAISSSVTTNSGSRMDIRLPSVAKLKAIEKEAIYDPDINSEFSALGVRGTSGY